MALSREVYRALEDIVGTRFISEDPAMLEIYRYNMAHTAIHLGPFWNTYTPKGEAVLLPGSTEEVQAIVKLCNRYKIKYKASSTFWAAMGYPNTEGAIQLDMRRMDRILEIDTKNMFAVIEPHVIGTQLQAEAMKVGLNTHIIGAGSSCSPLASATSYMGPGPDSMFMGYGEENLLGVEWVMPDGELIRTGSLGSDAGWSYGEGPGPGVRALIRGALGARGAMGVFTKCALKLYPWSGPTDLCIKGTVPAYQADLPKNIRAYTLAFPNWQCFADTAHKLWDAGIGYVAHRQFSMFGRDLKTAMVKILTDPTKTLDDLPEVLKDPEVPKLNEEMKRDFQFIMAGMTPRDFEWQDKALDEILASTGAYKVAAMNDPVIEGWTLAYLLRLGHKNLNLVYGGGYDGNFGMVGPPDFGTTCVEEAAEFKARWEDKGVCVKAGGDCMIGGIGGIGGGGSCMWENFVHFDPTDKFAVEGCCELFDETAKFQREKGWPPGLERLNGLCRGSDGREVPREIREGALSQSPQPVAFQYAHKIRETFNPNDLGDQYFLTLEKPVKK